MPLLGLAFVPTFPTVLRITSGTIGIGWFPIGLLALPYALARAWRRSVWRALGAFFVWGIWAYLGIGTSVPRSATGYAVLYGFFAWWLLSAAAICALELPRREPTVAPGRLSPGP